MKIKRLEYLLIGAEDVAEAADSWCDILGLSAASEPGPSSSVCLPLENGALLLTSETDRAGLLAIAVEVEGLTELVVRLREQGIEVSDPETQEGVTSAEVRPASSHGVPIRLIERPE
jgi:catechol 2,3-dioxygenase-like lactoylglutathione lyase family enzyme